MRAVEDHHVDRPDVDAQQWVKLTGPNRSIGLILDSFACSGKPRLLARRAAKTDILTGISKTPAFG